MSSSELGQTEGYVTSASMKERLQNYINLLEQHTLADPTKGERNQSLIRRAEHGLVLVDRAVQIETQIHKHGERIQNRNRRRAEVEDSLDRITAELDKVQDSINHYMAGNDANRRDMLLNEDRDAWAALSEELDGCVEEIQRLDAEIKDDSELSEKYRTELEEVKKDLGDVVRASDLAAPGEAMESIEAVLQRDEADEAKSQGTAVGDVANEGTSNAVCWVILWAIPVMVIAVPLAWKWGGI